MYRALSRIGYVHQVPQDSGIEEGLLSVTTYMHETDQGNTIRRRRQLWRGKHRRGSIMARHKPIGPWGNPNIEERFYTAVVSSIRHFERGEDNGSMLELTFQLEDSGLVFISRLYIPENFSAACQHRLWYFCQALGLEAYEIIEDPDVAVGRRLVIHIGTVQPPMANHGHAYSDVKRFLPFAEHEKDMVDSRTNTTW